MTDPSPSTTEFLQSRRVLVVEDEYMVAAEIALMLDEAGASVLGPVPDLAEAVSLVETLDGGIDVALLDVNLNGQPVWPLVDALLARSVPLVLTTGYDASAIPKSYLTLPRCEKPAHQRDILQALAQALK